MPASPASDFDFDEDIFFADGGTLRELVRHIIEGDADIVPEGDRIDTVIATVAAFGAEIEAHNRYRRWVQTVRYLEECTFLTPEGCPLGQGFQQQRIRLSGDSRLVSWVWNDPDGPLLAIHSERIGGRVRRYTWTRVDGLEEWPPENRAQARKSHSGRPPRESEARLLSLANLVC